MRGESADQFIEDITDAVNLVIDAFKAAKLKIPDETVRAALDECLRHHPDHIRIMRVNQRSVDPYKIVSWFGFSVAETVSPELQRSVITAVVRVLDYMLAAESPRGGLPQNTIEYLIDYTFNEIRNEPAHGIGKNGLFVAFHCSRVMKRKASRTFSRGWGGAA